MLIKKKKKFVCFDFYIQICTVKLGGVQKPLKKTAFLVRYSRGVIRKALRVGKKN